MFWIWSFLLHTSTCLSPPDHCRVSVRGWGDFCTLHSGRCSKIFLQASEKHSIRKHLLATNRKLSHIKTGNIMRTWNKNCQATVWVFFSLLQPTWKGFCPAGMNAVNGPCWLSVNSHACSEKHNTLSVLDAFKLIKQTKLFTRCCMSKKRAGKQVWWSLRTHQRTERFQWGFLPDCPLCPAPELFPWGYHSNVCHRRSAERCSGSWKYETSWFIPLAFCEHLSKTSQLFMAQQNL